MKLFILTISLLFLSIAIHSQQLLTKEFATSSIDTEFDINKIYNKQTEKRLTPKEFVELVNKNPNLPLERIYDKHGKVEKYYYNPNAVNNNVESQYNIKNGELFPELILKTVDNEIIDLSKLKGKLIILRFELFADNFRFNKNQITEIDAKINASNQKDEIEAIIIFTTTKEEVLRGFDLKNSNFKLVPNGDGFKNRCNIRSFPATLVIDRQGKLIDNFQFVDEIDLIKLLKR